MSPENERQYVIVPADPFRKIKDNIARFSEFHNAMPVEEGFSYTSDQNSDWLSVKTLRQLIENHLDND